MTRLDALGQADKFRFETMAPTTDGLPRNEWHHFVIHGDGARIIVNLSISDRLGLPDQRLIVLVHHDQTWSGWIERPGYAATGSTGLSVRFGASTLVFEDGAYRLELRIPSSGIHGRITFRPVSESMLKSNQPLGSGRFTWLLVPRLEADGHLWAGGVRYGMRRAPAYHDHNWGRFNWNDDFGWLWGSGLSSRWDSPWSVVMWQMTDRGHLLTRARGVALWHDNTPYAVFRDQTVSIEMKGLMRRAPRLTLPPVMAIVHPGTASDVPDRILADARRGPDRLSTMVRIEDYGRIVIPSDGEGPDAVLHELSTRIEMSGRVKGRNVEMEGTGVFELLH